MTSCASFADARIDVDGVAGAVHGLGPGRRAVVWVRGCGRACLGCMAVSMSRPGHPVHVHAVMADLEPLLASSDGLTVSGGEPFDQAGAVCALIAMAREARPDLEVLVYTGYLIEELESGTSEQRDLLARADLVVDGPFLIDAPNTLQWRGSDNQRVHLLSSRARTRYRQTADDLWDKVRPIQIQRLDDLTYRVIGMPRRGDLERMVDILAAQGLGIGVRE